jgi:hypothetical protein
MVCATTVLLGSPSQSRTSSLKKQSHQSPLHQQHASTIHIKDHKEVTPSSRSHPSSHHVIAAYAPLATLQTNTHNGSSNGMHQTHHNNTHSNNSNNNGGHAHVVRLPSATTLNNQSHAPPHTNPNNLTAATTVPHPHQTGYGYSTLLASRSSLTDLHITPSLPSSALIGAPQQSISPNGNAAQRLFVLPQTNDGSSSPTPSTANGFRTSIPTRYTQTIV